MLFLLFDMETLETLEVLAVLVAAADVYGLCALTLASLRREPNKSTGLAGVDAIAGVVVGAGVAG